MRYVLIGLVLLCTIGFVPSVANAQEGSSLQVQPAILDVGVASDGTAQAIVTLTNQSDQALAVSGTTRAFSPQDSVIDPSVVNRYDASRWISLQSENFAIEPKGSVYAVVDIAVPKDAVPGSHYALTIFRILNGPDQRDASGVEVTTEIGVVTLITVPGTAEEKVDLVSLKTGAVTFGGSITLSKLVMNTGNTHVAPIVTTNIVNSEGAVVDTIQQPIQLLMPNTKRTINLVWNSGGRVGSYSAQTLIAFGTPAQTQKLESLRFFVLPSLLTFSAWSAGVIFLIHFLYRHVRQRLKETIRDSSN